MPDGTSTLNQVKISELPVAPTVNDADQLEVSQAGTSRSIMVGQVKAAVIAGMPVGAISVPTLLALKAITVPPPVVITQGYNTAGDGGGGPLWVWQASSTATPDDFMTVALPSSAVGRYVRQLQAGASVSPKWAGCGLGAANDTARMAVVLNAPGAHAVDCSGCTLPLVSARIEAASTCPGMFSDGSCTITNASTSTVGDYLIWALKDDFYIDRISFVGPISHTVGARPPLNYMAAMTGSGKQRISNCTFTGSCFAAGFTGTNPADVFFQNNITTDTWGAALYIANPLSATVTNNQFHQCGWDQSLSAGVVVFANNFADNLCDDIVISGNVFRLCQITEAGTSVGQEAIDFFGRALRNLVISNNVCDRVGNGFLEFKSTYGSVSPTYGNVLISNNIVNFFTPGSGGTGVALNNNTSADGHQQNMKISGNRFYCEGATATATGITINGYDNVDISDNEFLSITTGISLSASNPGVDIARNVSIRSNKFNVPGNCIVSSSARRTDGLYITGNTCISSGAAPLALTGMTINGLVCMGNYFEITAGSVWACDLRNIQGGVVENNRFVGQHRGINISGTASTSLRIIGNDIQGFYPAIALDTASASVIVANNTVSIDPSQQIVLSVGAVTAFNNRRSARTTDPTGAIAGFVGDIVPNSSPTNGNDGWICTATGTTVTATWQAQVLLPVTTSAALAAQITDETGTGALVFATSPTLVTPLLGTPTSGNLANCTAFPAASLGGLGAGVGTWLATPTTANLAAAVTGETGTGALVFATSPTLVTPLLGTPTSGTLTNCTGYTVANVSGLAANMATFLATPTSANFAATMTDETGTGSNVFATSPTLVTPVLGSATATAVQLGNGAAATPSLNFTGATTSGLYKDVSGNAVGIATNAKPAILVSESGAAGAYVQLSSNNTPTVAAAGITNVGLQLTGAGTSGVDIQSGASARYLARFSGGATAVNYFSVAAAPTGNGPLLSAIGTDTDVDLRLAPQGAGLIRMGTASSVVANGAVATTMTSLGPTGSHTTVQEWLAIKNPSGVVRYIPLY